MATMTYFLKADPGDDVYAGYAIILRLETGAPLALGEALFADGTWRPDTDLADYRLRGKMDVDINEIPAERAREIITARHAAGRYRALPDPMPGDAGSDDPPRPQDEREARERLRASAAPVEAEIMRRWAEVPVPPGAADISFEPRRTIE